MLCRQLLDRLETRVTQIDDTAQDLLNRQLGKFFVETLSNRLAAQELTELLEWLCPAQINPRYDQAAYKERLTENTTSWIFKHETYISWMIGSISFLWIFGQCIHMLFAIMLTLIVGAGKSVLTYVQSHRKH